MLFAEKYVLENKLGEGAMGIVYRARHVQLDLEFAVKVLHPQYASDPTFRARFLREARVAHAFVHKRSVMLRDFGIADDGTPYLTMDLCPGLPLAGILNDEGRLAPERAVAICLQVVDVLAEAHEAGILHRDIKPDNIMVDTSQGMDYVKVMDFGIAKMIEGDPGDADLTRGSAIGTPLYMSPEQAAGERLDGRSDLYSLGVVLYEMVAGAPPFKAESVQALLMKHLTQPPPPLPPLLSGQHDPALESILFKARAKKSGDRFASAETFHVALAAYLEGDVSSVPGLPPFRAAVEQPSTEAKRLRAAQHRLLSSSLGADVQVSLQAENNDEEWLSDQLGALSSVRPASETLAPFGDSGSVPPVALEVSPAREVGEGGMADILTFEGRSVAPREVPDLLPTPLSERFPEKKNDVRDDGDEGPSNASDGWFHADTGEHAANVEIAGAGDLLAQTLNTSGSREVEEGEGRAALDERGDTHLPAEVIGEKSGEASAPKGPEHGSQQRISPKEDGGLAAGSAEDGGLARNSTKDERAAEPSESASRARARQEMAFAATEEAKALARRAAEAAARESAAMSAEVRGPTRGEAKVTAADASAGSGADAGDSGRDSPKPGSRESDMQGRKEVAAGEGRLLARGPLGLPGGAGAAAAGADLAGLTAEGAGGAGLTAKGAGGAGQAVEGHGGVGLAVEGHSGVGLAVEGRGGAGALAVESDAGAVGNEVYVKPPRRILRRAGILAALTVLLVLIVAAASAVYRIKNGDFPDPVQSFLDDNPGFGEKLGGVLGVNLLSALEDNGNTSSEGGETDTAGVGQGEGSSMALSASTSGRLCGESVGAEASSADTGAVATEPEKIPIKKNTAPKTVARADGWVLELDPVARVKYVNRTQMTLRGDVPGGGGRAEVWGQDVPVQDGKFACPLTLREGKNRIKIVGFSSQGQTTRELTIVVDTHPPELKVEVPLDNRRVLRRKVPVSGVADDKNLMEVRVNDMPLIVEGNRFSGFFPLKMGENRLSVVATDLAGNKTTRVHRVTRVSRRGR